MAIGVSYEAFWHGEPAIVGYAIETEKLRQKNIAILSDVAAWNTGRYVMVAVGVVLSQAFDRNSQATYPSEPLLATELDDQLKEQKRERDLRKQRDGFLALAAALSLQNSNGAGTP